MVASCARPMTTTCVAPALAIISASRYPPSIVFRSATMGWLGKRAWSVSAARSPSASSSGVPASSQSTPAAAAISAISIASARFVRSREIWTMGESNIRTGVYQTVPGAGCYVPGAVLGARCFVRCLVLRTSHEARSTAPGTQHEAPSTGKCPSGPYLLNAVSASRLVAHVDGAEDRDQRHGDDRPDGEHLARAEAVVERTHHGSR